MHEIAWQLLASLSHIVLPLSFERIRNLEGVGSGQRKRGAHFKEKRLGSNVGVKHARITLTERDNRSRPKVREEKA
jgi:hypothetical protein